MSFLKSLIAGSILLGSAFNITSSMKSNLASNIDAPDKPEISEVATNISNPKSPYNTINMKSAIMDKNLLYVTGFEDGDSPFSFGGGTGNRFQGGQSKVNEFSSDGLYSIKIDDTHSNSNVSNGHDLDGNFCGWNIISRLTFNKTYYLPDDEYLAMNFDVLFKNKKSNASTVITPIATGDYRVDTAPPMSNYFSGVDRYTRDAKKGDTRVYVNNADKLYNTVNINRQNIYIADRQTKLGDYGINKIINVNKEEQYFELDSPLATDINAGDICLRHVNPGRVSFKSTEIATKDSWQTICLTTKTNMWNYTPSKRGVTFMLESNTPDTLYVDNIRFGYANKLHLYRDGNKIYEGYNLSYKDSSVRDLTAPKKVENIQSDIIIKNNNINTIRINIPTIEDMGTEYNYTLKASYDGMESEESETYTSTITSGFDGFSYIIDNNPLTIPDNTIDTRSNYIEKDVSNNEDIYYLHIKSIDKSGNVSETSHIELQAFKTTVEEPKVLENGVNLTWDLNSNLNMDNVYFKVSKRNADDNDFNEIATNIKDLEYIDNTSTDINPPDMPSISNINYNSDTNNVEYTISEVLDNPTTYEYFVEMFNESDNTKISKSNIQSVDVLFGIKGVYYTIDNNPNSEVINGIELLNNKIEIPLTSEETYLHIKAVDNNNNESDTLHLKISDNENPTLDLRLSEYLPTKNNVTIVATGNDNITVDYILLPNGEKRYTNALTYEVTNNGEFEFIIFDKAGNSYTKSIEVTNIDREVDNVTITKAPTLFTKDKVTIKVRANDVSGINYIILPDGTKTFENNVDYDVFEDGVYNFTIRDNAGNEKVYSVTVDNIDKIFPSVTVSKNDNWTNQGVQININTRD